MLAPHGLKNATTDPEVVREWFGGRPYLNLGIRCDTLVVIDQDGEEGLRTWSELIAQNGDGDTLSARTGSGGGHAVYECDHADDFVSRVRFAPGLDLRAGRGAYIVVEPSRHRTGGRYRWHREWPATLVLPGWLEEILPRRDRTPRPAAPRATVAPGESSRYGLRAFDGELDAVERTPEGRRNARLYLAARNLGELIAGGELSAVGIEEALAAAGARSGLGAAEISKTVRSGLSAGMETPRRAPERGK